MEENPGGSQSPPDGGAGEMSAKRPSLAERLMNPPKDGPLNSGGERASSRPEVDATARPLLTAEPQAADAPSQDSVSHRPAFTSFSSTSNLIMSQSLNEARRLMRLRYFAFLGSIAILFTTLIAAASTLAVFLLSDGGWEELAASGVVAGAALLLLILVQYRPAAGFAAAAAEIAGLDALSSHLQKSYALWDGFLDQSGSTRQVGANDVALAVSSMTSATREIIALQTQLLESRRGTARTGPAHRVMPTPTSPDPRRY
jgi:hypothetical protein